MIAQRAGKQFTVDPAKQQPQKGTPKFGGQSDVEEKVAARVDGHEEVEDVVEAAVEFPVQPDDEDVGDHDAGRGRLADEEHDHHGDEDERGADLGGDHGVGPHQVGTDVAGAPNGADKENVEGGDGDEGNEDEHHGGEDGDEVGVGFILTFLSTRKKK